MSVLVCSFPKVSLKGHLIELCIHPVPADVALSPRANAVHLPLLYLVLKLTNTETHPSYNMVPSQQETRPNLTNHHHRGPEQLTACIVLFGGVEGVIKASCLQRVNRLGEGPSLHLTSAWGTQLEELFCFHHLARASPRGASLLLPALSEASGTPLCWTQPRPPSRPADRVPKCSSPRPRGLRAPGTSSVTQADVNPETSLLGFAAFHSTSFFTPFKASSLGLQPEIKAGISRGRWVPSAGIPLAAAEGIRLR